MVKDKLEKEVDSLSKDPAKSHVRLVEVKERLETIYRIEGERIKFRSRVKWMVDNEKCVCLCL